MGGRMHLMKLAHLLTLAMLCACAAAKADVAEGCAADPLRIARWDEIIRAVHIYGLDEIPIVFLQCSYPVFETLGKGAQPGRRSYTIRYSMHHAKDKRDLLAPLIHELAHVYQSQQLHSYTELRRQPILPNELSADFLAGIVFSKMKDKFDLSLFQQNLILSARYIEHSEEAHGTPVQRISSFRMGIFLQPRALGDNLALADQEFRQNRLAFILTLR